MSNINYDLKKIKGFVFDVDGVLSTECIPLHPGGEPMRMINTKDGYAMQLAVKCGYQLAIITGGNTEAVKIRFRSLGVSYIYLASKIKIVDLNDFMKQTGLRPEEIVFAGDDIPDYQPMLAVGLPVSPADGVPEIKGIAKYISHKKGGEGVGRDIIEQVMKAQGTWMQEETAFGW